MPEKPNINIKPFYRPFLFLFFILLIAILGYYVLQMPSPKAEAAAKDLDNVQGLTAQNIQKIRDSIQADKKTRIIDSVFRLKVQQQGFNGNVLIAQSGVVLYKKSFGYANFDKHDTLAAPSKFQLASLSKTFTAIAMMRLYEAGKISLENTVQEFFPDFPYAGVTIRSLLSHRSGIPNYIYAFDKEVRKNKVYPSNDSLMQWFAKYKPEAYNKPDHFHNYNNSNYAVLASIIEKISGTPFDEYLRKDLFLPLKMNDTWVITTKDSAINQFRTKGYEGNNFIEKDFYDDIVGDKGVYSTTSDLLKWHTALSKNLLLKPETMHEIFTPRSFEFAGYRNYGYGFRLWLDAQNRTDYIYHTGWWKGYNSVMWFSLKDDFVIIVLGNRYNKTVYNLRDLVDILHGGGKSTIEEDVREENAH